MFHGQIVSLPGFTRRGIVLRVTLKDIKTTGVQVLRPGLYVFSGYWYGEDPLDYKCYGKIEGRHGRPFGRAVSHHQARRVLGGWPSPGWEY